MCSASGPGSATSRPRSAATSRTRRSPSCAPSRKACAGSTWTSPRRTRWTSSGTCGRPRWRPRGPSSPRRGTGTPRGALKALGAFRVLCAHRHGSYGVAVWMARIEAWLESELDRGRWYAGRPLLVTENDYSLHLRNGDTGRGRGDGAGQRQRGVRAARRGRHVRAHPALRGGHGVRDDRAQEPGLAVRDGRRAAALGRFADPHARAALHRGHARAEAPGAGRARRSRSAPRWAPDRARLRAAGPAAA